MNQEQLRMIELRFLGKTHQEVANIINREFNKKYNACAIRNRFKIDGTLYLAYHEYAAKQEEFSEENIRNQYKSMTVWAVNVRRSLVQAAIKKGDLATALRILQDIDDRAGNVVIRKSQINVKEEKRGNLSDVEFSKELTRFGIDPRTGVRVGEASQTKN